jgi:hypothetical protein
MASGRRRTAQPSTLVLLAGLCAALLGPRDLAWCEGGPGHSEIEPAGATCCLPTAADSACWAATRVPEHAPNPALSGLSGGDCNDVLLPSLAGLPPTGSHEVAPPQARAAAVPAMNVRATVPELAATDALPRCSAQLLKLLRSTVLTI